LIDLEIHPADPPYRGLVPCLAAFKGLRKLSVVGIGDGCDGLGTLIANSPGLLHLDIAGDPHPGREDTSLPEIFALVPLEQTMRLQKLGISFQVQKWGPILHHLQQLQSLRLYVHRQLDDTDSIWKSLRNSGVNLQHVYVDYVDGGFLDYLSSSPTSHLETLRITDTYRDGGFTEEHAYRFFNTVLPRHARSLKTISIYVRPGNKFYFHGDHASSLLCCKQLEILNLSFASASLWDPDSDFKNKKMLSDVVRFEMCRHNPMI
jgi:hypothetical protein